LASTSQTELLKDDEPLRASWHVQLCFGFLNYVGFGKRKINKKITELVKVAVDVLGWCGVFMIWIFGLSQDL